MTGTFAQRERREEIGVRPKAGNGDDPKMGLEAHGITIRRVGFRFGTHAELAAMHLVESEIEADRGRGLAKWAKASMLAINTPLGFTIIETRTEWQGQTAELRSALPT